MRKKLISILAATLLASPLAFAQTEDATLIKADALIKEGKPADAFALLEPLEAKLAGNATYDYLLATAALNAGNPSRATFIYERILAINPEFIGVRADMGRAYYQMGDLARAKLEFESILALSNLPPDLRSAVETYLAALSQLDAGQKRVIGGEISGTRAGVEELARRGLLARLGVNAGVEGDAEALAAAKNLKVIARAGVGLDNVDIEAATNAGVMVVNAPTSNITSVPTASRSR